MGYKPKAEASGNSNNFTPKVAPNGKPYLFPTPNAGNQAARISLIVDLGTQEREDFEDPKTKEVKPQKPVQQVVVFADLVDEIVDYGGDIGEQQYRLMLNKSFKGDIQGIAFTAVPPRDEKGNMIEGKEWTFHPQNLLTKLAKATENEQILGSSRDDNMDISQLLGAAFYADVEVKETEGKKKDADGKTKTYKNVNFKQAGKVPQVKGKPVDVDELRVEPLIINHDNVTEETLLVLRREIINMMKLAPEYSGSTLEKLLTARGDAAPEPKEKTEEAEPEQETPAAKPKADKKATGKNKPAPVQTPADEESEDPDIPF
jgi:hypothetical protein